MAQPLAVVNTTHLEKTDSLRSLIITSLLESQRETMRARKMSLIVLRDFRKSNVEIKLSRRHDPMNLMNLNTGLAVGELKALSDQ